MLFQPDCIPLFPRPNTFLRFNEKSFCSYKLSLYFCEKYDIMKRGYIIKNFIVIILLCITPSGNVFAQYVPKEGDVIAFLPVADNVKKTISGFDCFYDGDRIEGKNEHIFKSKFRLNPDSNMLTPFSEIDSHFFLILSQENYIPQEKSQKGYYMLTMKRDDEKKVVLKIPFMPESNENILTKGMRDYEGVPRTSLLITAKESFSVNIPCYTKSEYEQMKNHIGDTVVASYNPLNKRPQEYTSYFRTWDEMCRRINASKSKVGIYETGAAYTIVNLLFNNVEGFIYKQIFAVCTRKKQTTLFPIFVYRSKGNDSRIVIRNYSYSFWDFFEREKEKMEKVDDSIQKLIRKYSGKRVYYGVEKVYDPNLFEDSWGVLYRLNKGSYDCTGFRYDNTSKGNGVHAVIKDSIGTLFMIPLVYTNNINAYMSQSYRFEECFKTQEDLDVIEEKQRKVEDDLQYIAQKYGQKYANEYRDYPGGREKFLRLVKKYNSNTAKQMVDKNLQIGWTYQMVIDALGEPDEKHTSEYPGSYHEHWDYSRTYKKYLHFVNGKLYNIIRVSSGL